ncbi:hypothetical protein [uncultured Porphyromonas sp.]|uniref:hypothetical protein n=1 Tax=uncultured Porphyromonas sp. TaxID=159274 RepID=UPI002604EFA0|nr:hypothetical protein [uncultured Porphyromonas sp.]
MTAQQSYEPSSREESPEVASHAIATPSSEPQSETGVPSATDESEEETHPEGAIRLMDGTILTCYPKPEEEMPQEVVADELQLDKTGEYFGIGRRRIAPKPVVQEEQEELRQLFKDNAFYLLAHRERILQDSRMFLTPIVAHNGLAYTGTSGFHRPTIGIYLEWWSHCLGTMVISDSGRMSLVYQIAGSPLSGSNSCGQLYESGESAPIRLSGFSKYWQSLMQINTRYDEAKQIYQAYTLQELLDILHEEDGGEKDFTTNVRERFFRHRIEQLTEQVDHHYREACRWRYKYEHAVLRLHDSEVRQIYADYEDLEQRVKAQIEELRRQKQSLKRQLQSEQLTPRSYQFALKPLNKQIDQLKSQLYGFEYNVKERFRDEGIHLYDIRFYVQNNGQARSVDGEKYVRLDL